MVGHEGPIRIVRRRPKRHFLGGLQERCRQLHHRREWRMALRHDANEEAPRCLPIEPNERQSSASRPTGGTEQQDAQRRRLPAGSRTYRGCGCDHFWPDTVCLHHRVERGLVRGNDSPQRP